MNIQFIQSLIFALICWKILHVWLLQYMYKQKTQENPSLVPWIFIVGAMILFISDFKINKDETLTLLISGLLAFIAGGVSSYYLLKAKKK